ncbi:hypothetical protein [Streptomyces californicus]|uniref:hypothetical protein n=1 Tax=Streptomyces californicus TaxID=67351 RepID=UPI00296FD0F5|nr:hypothetical protein [Streptomyces californicus]MDW4918688.1 hypothetical protein [Streptomyces californicus]
MPKDSRARTLAVREVMKETGLPYNRAAHHLDRTPTDTDRAVATDDLSEERLHVLPFLVYCTVPASADRAELAQDLADQLHTLRRNASGEEYEGRADVIVPGSPWAPEPQQPGYVSALLLVHAWAMRPWDQPGEADAVVSDFHAVARSWVTSRYPAIPTEGLPVALPLGWHRAQVLAATAEFTAHTAGEHTDLPEGWEELITARRTEVAVGSVNLDAQGTRSDWPGDDRAIEPPKKAGGLPLVPNLRGGADKTVAAVSLPLPSHQPVDIDSSPLHPYRVVDVYLQGWYQRSGDGRYDADRGRARGLETMTYRELDAARGPLRPVEPPSTADCSAVKTALAGAGRKAAASLLVAAFRLSDKDARAGRTTGARNWLCAGREGSHESATLAGLAWGIGSDLAETPKRYDPEAVNELVRVIEGWVSSPGRYVEVADNLAWLFSCVADEAGGWAAVADQYLQRHQRVGPPDHVVEAVQLYLMSQSRTHTFG